MPFSLGLSPITLGIRRQNALRNFLLGGASHLINTYSSDGQGFAMDFTTRQGEAYISDAGTPANDVNVNGANDFDAFNSVLTYTSPSVKMTRGPGGASSVLRYAAHNLVTYSEDISNAAWSKTAITANSASEVEVSSTGSYRYLAQNYTLVNGFQYGLYVELKYNNHDYAWILYDVGNTDYFVPITIGADSCAAGTPQNVTNTATDSSATVTVTDVGGGWYGIRVDFSNAGSGSQQLGVGLTDNAAGGDMAPATAGQKIDVRKFHFYRGPADTTYLPTTSAARYSLPIEWGVDGNPLGVLVESAATNLLTESTDLETWTDSDTTTSAAGITTPFGTTGAYKIIPNTSNTNHNIGRSFAGSPTGVHSVIVKAAEYSKVMVYEGNEGYGFDLSSGTTSSVSGITPPSDFGIIDLNNGWYRCWIYGASSSYTRIYVLEDFSGFSFAGDGTSGVYAVHGQFETGSVATSIIETQGSTVTRAADNLSIATSAFPHSATAGTLYIEAIDRSDVTGADYYADLESSTSTRVLMYGISGNHIMFVRSGGATQASLTLGSRTADATFKVVGAYAADDFAGSHNGATVLTDTSGTVPFMDTLYVGAASGGVAQYNGHITAIAYIPERVADATLETMTS